jgi:hypothetical protein
LPKRRPVPANAVLSNTGKIQIDQDQTYRPENLLNKSADSYAMVTAIAASEV